VSIIDGTLAEAHTLVGDGAARTDDRHVIGAHVRGHVEAGPLAGYRVDAAFDAYERALRDARRMRSSRVETVRG
jgi:hypothetical protein